VSRVAVIGGGQMGEALIVTAVNGGTPADDITVVEPNPDRAAVLRDTHGVRTAALADAVAGADVIVLVVKPHFLSDVLDPLRGVLTESQLVISLVLGVRIAAIEDATGLSAPAVIRACPNLAIAQGSGFTAITAGDGVQPDQLKLAESLLAAGGPVAQVTEPQLDVVSVVSGSVPAWYCYIVEAMTDAGVLLGLGHELSAQIAEQGLIGAGAMLRDRGQPAVQVRAAVSSPGGSTIAGVRVLEERAVRGAFLAASAAGVDRAREAGAKYENKE